MIPDWLTRITAAIGALLCGYIVVVRLIDVVKDLYYGTGNRHWFLFSAMKMLVWGAMATGCVFRVLAP